MQPQSVNPDVLFPLAAMLICLLSLIFVAASSFFTNSRLQSANEKLVESVRVLALAFANPNAAIRLEQKRQQRQLDPATAAILKNEAISRARKIRTRCGQNAAANPNLSRPEPTRYQSIADADIVPPEPQEQSRTAPQEETSG